MSTINQATQYKEKFSTIKEIAELNAINGGKWFTPDNMAFFNTFIHGDLIKGRYFITSNYPKDQPENKAYSLHMAKNCGSIETIFDFNCFATLAQAKKALKELPKEFYQAFTCAHTEYTTGKSSGMGFMSHAEIELTNTTNGGIKYSLDSFTGACSYIALNWQKLGFNFVETLIQDSEVFNPDIAEITKHYEICALWASYDIREDEKEVNLDTVCTIEDITPAQHKKHIDIVTRFVKDNLYTLIQSRLPIGEIGHSLWLSQNGHGSGFFDQSLAPYYVDQAICDTLQAQAGKIPEITLYINDTNQIDGL